MMAGAKTDLFDNKSSPVEYFFKPYGHPVSTLLTAESELTLQDATTYIVTSFKDQAGIMRHRIGIELPWNSSNLFNHNLKKILFQIRPESKETELTEKAALSKLKTLNATLLMQSIISEQPEIADESDIQDLMAFAEKWTEDDQFANNCNAEHKRKFIKCWKKNKAKLGHPTLPFMLNSSGKVNWCDEILFAGEFSLSGRSIVVSNKTGRFSSYRHPEMDAAVRDFCKTLKKATKLEVRYDPIKPTRELAAEIWNKILKKDYSIDEFSKLSTTQFKQRMIIQFFMKVFKLFGMGKDHKDYNSINDNLLALLEPLDDISINAEFLKFLMPTIDEYLDKNKQYPMLAEAVAIFKAHAKHVLRLSKEAAMAQLQQIWEARVPSLTVERQQTMRLILS